MNRLVSAGIISVLTVGHPEAYCRVALEKCLEIRPPRLAIASIDRQSNYHELLGTTLKINRLALPPISSNSSTIERIEKGPQDSVTYEAEVTRRYGRYLEEEAEAYSAFLKAAGAKWGHNNVWQPLRTTWVVYREDWLERSAVQFEDGIVNIEVIVPDNADPAAIQQSVTRAVETLALSDNISPIEMMRRKLFPNKQPEKTAPNGRILPQKAQPIQKFYTVKPGDSLWKLSRKFNVSQAVIADANHIAPDSWLKIGQKLLIPGPYAPPPAAPASTPPRDPRLAPPDKQPLLAHQVKLADGRDLTRDNAHEFANEIARQRNYKSMLIKGDDGKERRVVQVSFPLVPDHLRIRAERYKPLIMKYAKELGVYPPLIFAVIHTESAFNPHARSSAPAFGLMQLVPRSGARDAYRFLYHQDKLVSGNYLYAPENNIRLGAAFLHIIDTHYFRGVKDPLSRMLCCIAAYNTGAGNVCRAFGSGTSLSRAAPIINTLSAQEVYSRLLTNLPYAETRQYVKRVSDRIPLYRNYD